jgi:hypothetical protein
VQPESFRYDEKAYVDALEQFVQAIDLKGPYAVVTHGYAVNVGGITPVVALLAVIFSACT